ncbi:hypothetical protein PHLCEN_2v12750 [Hermanssonia centrifuga]|uniref:FAD/NAD(P)-binding domain-containing protein n=1 Tax=Hermanssonia centrifuga TaxID=98765 RepID=A0A2R6NG69_9APHY|nr:hypothetical protein PHLCEN_2v12750 [Hermanssonia centrifuga]
MLSRAFPEQGIPDAKLDFDYLVYALGSHLPQPIDLWAKEGSAIYGGTKSEGVDWMKRAQTRIEQAPSVLVVGGGALGIQYATDIATAYPDKPVTLLHSRDRLLPRFDERMHTKIRSAMSDLGINVILGDRVDLSSITAAGGQEQKVRTLSGREIQAGLVLLCTGQQPNTELFRDMLPSSLINDGPKKGLLRVNRALQIQTEQDGDLTVPYPHIFAVGDTADAFGAINAGHNAARQGDLAANNILRLIRQAESQTSVQGAQKDSACELESYSPGPPGIKVTVGLTRAVYQRNGNVGDKHDDPLDGNAAYMWKNFGHQEPVGEEDMYA